MLPRAARSARAVDSVLAEAFSSDPVNDIPPMLDALGDPEDRHRFVRRPLSAVPTMADVMPDGPAHRLRVYPADLVGEAWAQRLHERAQHHRRRRDQAIAMARLLHRRGRHGEARRQEMHARQHARALRVLRARYRQHFNMTETALLEAFSPFRPMNDRERAIARRYLARPRVLLRRGREHLRFLHDTMRDPAVPMRRKAHIAASVLGAVVPLLSPIPGDEIISAALLHHALKVARGENTPIHESFREAQRYAHNWRRVRAMAMHEAERRLQRYRA